MTPTSCMARFDYAFDPNAARQLEARWVSTRRPWSS